MSDAVLAIDVDGLGLALSVDVIEEILDPPAHRPLPHAPAHLTGLACVRGAPLPLVDLGLLVDQAASAPDAERVVIVDVSGARAGLFVSRVRGVVSGATRRPPGVPMSLETKIASVPLGV